MFARIMKSKKGRKNVKRYHKTKKVYKRHKKQKGGAIIELPIDNFELINEIQDTSNNINKHIYKISIDECMYYFTHNGIESYNYLLFILLPKSNTNELKQKYYIINRTNIKNIEDITHIETEISKIENETESSSVIKRRLNNKGVLIINIFNCVTKNTQDKIKKAKVEIDRLNMDLQDKCTNLKLHLDYMYNMQGGITSLYGIDSVNSLILCLYLNNKCISSIIISISKVHISFSSKTMTIYEGLGYNKLLRSVLIIIAKLLSDTVIKVNSLCENPISAYLLINYFKGVLDMNKKSNINFIKYFKETSTDEKSKKNIETQYVNIPQKILNDYNEIQIKNGNILNLYVYVQLTDENIENAKKIFNETLESEKFKCDSIH